MNEIQDLRICVEKALPEHKNTLQGLKNISNSEKHFDKLKAAFYTEKLWRPNSTIRIKFLENPPYTIQRTPLKFILNTKDENGELLKIDPLQKVVSNMKIIDAIIKIVNERVQPFIGLNLIFVKSNEYADIKIAFDPNGGAWSYIGKDCLQTPQNEPSMNFGWFDVSTTIHEFGHALGMIHEHQNPKGNTIKWNEQKVYNWARKTQGWNQQNTYHNIIEKYNSNMINGSKFDPESIMLYFFPGSLTLNNKGTHQNLRLSTNDVIYLNSMYPIKNIKNKLSPEEFYKNVYGETINPAKQLSIKNEENVPENFAEVSSSNTVKKNKKFKPDFTNISYVLSFIFIIFIILFYMKK